MWFQRSLLLLSMACIFFFMFEVKDANAEVPPCIELSSPKIGSTCYTEVPYNVRVENSKQAQAFETPQAALPGFVIVDTRDIQESRIGTTNGPSIIITRPGTALKIRQAYQQAYQDFNNFYGRTESEVRIRGINFGGMSEIRQRTEEQFNNAINQLTQIQSNSEAIIIKGSAQAQWRVWLGVVEYTSGGTLRGKIRVYQRYVGTANQPSQISSNAKNQILALVQNANPEKAPPIERPTTLFVRPFDGKTFDPVETSLVVSGGDGWRGWSWDGKTASYLAVNARGETVLFVRPFDGKTFDPVETSLVVSNGDGWRGWSWDGKTASYLAT